MIPGSPGKKKRRPNRAVSLKVMSLWRPADPNWKLSRQGVGKMNDPTRSTRLGLRGLAIIATAVGAVAVGASAIAVLAIGRLAIRRIIVEKARFKSLEIQDLTVTRLRANEVIVSEALHVPEKDLNSGSA